MKEELIEKLRNVIDENEKNGDFAIATETVRVYLDEMEQALSQSEGEIKEELIEKLKQSMKYKLDDNQNCIIDTCLIDEAIKALSQSEWISVEDKLPDSIGSYLCFWENCYVGMLFFNSKKEWWQMWKQEKHNPTHWMPLPQPPQTK